MQSLGKATQLHHTPGNGRNGPFATQRGSRALLAEVRQVHSAEHAVLYILHSDVA